MQSINVYPIARAAIHIDDGDLVGFLVGDRFVAFVAEDELSPDVAEIANDNARERDARVGKALEDTE